MEVTNSCNSHYSPASQFPTEKKTAHSSRLTETVEKQFASTKGEKKEEYGRQLIRETAISHKQREGLRGNRSCRKIIRILQLANTHQERVRREYCIRGNPLVISIMNTLEVRFRMEIAYLMERRKLKMQRHTPWGSCGRRSETIVRIKRVICESVTKRTVSGGFLRRTPGSFKH